MARGVRGMSWKVTEPGRARGALQPYRLGEALCAGREPLVGSPVPAWRYRASAALWWRVWGFGRNVVLGSSREGATPRKVKLNLPVFGAVFLGATGRRSRNFSRLGELLPLKGLLLAISGRFPVFARRRDTTN